MPVSRHVTLFVGHDDQQVYSEMRMALCRAVSYAPRMKQPDAAKSMVLHENVPMIEVADGVLLDALLADRTTSRWIAARLSERVAVVVPGSLDALIERLRRHGHLPKVLDE
jgi:hypothetical protein